MFHFSLNTAYILDRKILDILRLVDYGWTQMLDIWDAYWKHVRDILATKQTIFGSMLINMLKLIGHMLTFQHGFINSTQVRKFLYKCEWLVRHILDISETCYRLARDLGAETYKTC